MKPGRLLASWSAREKDFKFQFPSKPDGHWLYWLLCVQQHDGRTVVQELEARGYDVKSIRFQVDKRIRSDAATPAPLPDAPLGHPYRPAPEPRTT